LLKEVKHALSKSRHTANLMLSPADNRRLADLCGKFDQHLRQLERYLGVEINNRGHDFQVIGPKSSVEMAMVVLQKLYHATEQKNNLDTAKIFLTLQTERNKVEAKTSKDYSDISIHTQQRIIHPRGKNQHHYLKNILSHDINFGIGPSGTGKTYLAVACAVTALENNSVRRIVLVRPAVEAGEKLGFLPGDLAEKVNPYLRPIYDALHEMLGSERLLKLIETDVIEVAPLAFMRGRSLNDSFVILDESQNTTKEQMKMFLTRIGFGSQAVITGDITQIDLPSGVQSGLRHIIEVLKDIDEISFTFFQANDVVRHPIVQRIVEAYDNFENPDES